MADRFTYIPIIGLFIMVVYGVPEILKGWRYRKAALATSGGLLVSILVAITISQVQYWSMRLFNHTLQVTVKNFLIRNNLGVTLMRQGAVHIDTDYAEARYNLGTALFQQGRNEEALRHLS